MIVLGFLGVGALGFLLGTLWTANAKVGDAWAGDQDGGDE